MSPNNLDSSVGDPPETPTPEIHPASQRPITAIVAIAFVLGLALVGLVTSKAAPDKDSSRLEAEPLPVTVQVAEVLPSHTVRRSFVGRIEARRESRIGFELGGRVDLVKVDEGEGVERGELLAELDTDRLRARRLGLVAQLERAEADAALALATLERVREAQDLDAVSSQALDEASLGLTARQATVSEARAAIEQVDVELAKSRLTAPFGAVVVGRSVDEGQVVDAGTPVLHLLENARPEARIGVAGDALDALEPGQAVTVKVGGADVPATVRTILPVRGRSTRAVDAILELDAVLEAGSASSADGEGDGEGEGEGSIRVRSGDLARLELEQSVGGAGFWLPLSALTESSRGLWAVYVVVSEGGGENDGMVERRELEILHEEAERVFARGTLDDGDRVVTTGLHRLVPGQRVSVRAEEAAR